MGHICFHSILALECCDGHLLDNRDKYGIPKVSGWEEMERKTLNFSNLARVCAIREYGQAGVAQRLSSLRMTLERSSSSSCCRGVGRCKVFVFPARCLLRLREQNLQMRVSAFLKQKCSLGLGGGGRMIRVPRT